MAACSTAWVDPGDRAADGERRREQRSRQAGRRHHDAGEELDVARQRAVRLEPAQRVEDAALDIDRLLDEVAAEPDGDLPQQRRPGIARAVDGVAEAHDPAAGGDLALHPRRRARRVTDGVEGIEGPARRTAVERAGEGAEGGTDHVGHVGAGRGDDTCGERRRVEAVVDRQDEVLLERPRRDVGRGLAGHGAEVGRRRGQVRCLVERVLTEADAVQGGDDRRDHGGDAQALGGALVRRDVDERAQAELVGGDRHGGPDAPQRRSRSPWPAARGQGPATPAGGGRRRPRPGTRPARRRPAGGRGRRGARPPRRTRGGPARSRRARGSGRSRPRRRRHRWRCR